MQTSKNRKQEKKAKAHKQTQHKQTIKNREHSNHFSFFCEKRIFYSAGRNKTYLSIVVNLCDV